MRRDGGGGTEGSVKILGTQNNICCLGRRLCGHFRKKTGLRSQEQEKKRRIRDEEQWRGREMGAWKSLDHRRDNAYSTGRCILR